MILARRKQNLRGMRASVQIAPGLRVTRARLHTGVVIVAASPIARSAVPATCAATDRTEEARNDETSESARQGHVA